MKGSQTESGEQPLDSEWSELLDEALEMLQDHGLDSEEQREKAARRIATMQSVDKKLLLQIGWMRQQLAAAMQQALETARSQFGSAAERLLRPVRLSLGLAVGGGTLVDWESPSETLDVTWTAELIGSDGILAVRVTVTSVPELVTNFADLLGDWILSQIENLKESGGPT